MGPILAGPICDGVSCLPIALIFLIAATSLYIEIGLVVVFGVITFLSWRKRKWTKLTVLYLLVSLLFAALATPQLVSAFRDNQKKAHVRSAFLSSIDYQVYQPADKALQDYELRSFTTDEYKKPLEFQASYYSSTSRGFVTVDMSIATRGNSPFPDCPSNSAVSKESEQSCEQVGRLADGSALYRQADTSRPAQAKYFTKRGVMHFWVARSALSPDEAIDLLEGFKPVTKEQLRLHR